MPLLEEEPIGVGPLSQMADRIFAETEPDAMLSSTESFSFEQVDGRYELRFWLPQLDKSNLDIGIKDRELILAAGSYTRVFSLPDTLADRQIEEATFREGSLQLSFQSTEQ